MADPNQSPPSAIESFPGYRLVPDTDQSGAPEAAPQLAPGYRVVPDDTGSDIRGQMGQMGYQFARGLSYDLPEKFGLAPPGAKEYEAQHPVGSAVLRTAGATVPTALAAAFAPEGVLPAALTTVSSFPRALAANTALGAGVGALSGYGQSTDHPIRDTAAGAVFGGGFGAAGTLVSEFASPSLQGLAARMSGTAADRLALAAGRRRYLQDLAGGGPSAAEMSAMLSEYPDLPMGIVDVAGPNVRSMAGSLARTSDAGRAIATDFFDTRDAQTAGRLLDTIDRHVSAGGNAYDVSRLISQRQRQIASPLYMQAYNSPPINPDLVAPGGELAGLMQRDAMREASRQALRIASNEGRDPSSLGLTFNAAGDPAFERVPSWQTLDYLKRGLDDTLSAHRNDFGVLQRDENVNAIDNLRRTFRDLLVRENPAYGQALQAWGGLQQVQRALSIGQNFKNYRPELLRDQLSQMNPGERQAALLGAADTMRKDVLTSPGGDEARRILSRDPRQTDVESWREQQLRPFFANDQDYRQFVGRVLSERRMFGTQREIMGGSQTAERQAEDAAHGGGGGALNSALQLGAGAAATLGHEPFAGVPMMVRGSQGILGSLRQPSEAIQQRVAQGIFNPDLNANLGVLSQLEGARARLGIVPTLTPGAVELTSRVPGNILGNYYEQRYGQR
jgi:hypothetical protein